MKLIITTLVLSIFGISDTVYLTIKRYTNEELNCSFLDGCNFVTNSEYSVIFGIPVAVLGLLFYITIFTLSLLYLRTKNRKFLVSTLGLSSTGFLLSLWFIYSQAFILNAFCLYCLASAVLSTTIFTLSVIAMVNYNNSEKGENIENV